MLELFQSLIPKELPLFGLMVPWNASLPRLSAVELSQSGPSLKNSLPGEVFVETIIGKSFNIVLDLDDE